jgi:hypothetical protein
MENSNLLKSFINHLESEVYSKFELLISDHYVHLVDGAPSKEMVKDLLPTLRARKSNTTLTKREIFGLSTLIENLMKLDLQEIILGYGYISPKMAGNAYFLSDGVTAIGVAVVDR